MCGRYVFWNPDGIRERYETKSMVSWEPSYNITPGMINPVITRQSPNRVVLMKWGLIPFWAKDPKIGYKMINARAEDIEAKPAFRRPIRNTRCLVPCDGFYEWKRLTLEKKEEKIPWFIGLKDKSTFSLAGIFDIWKDAEGKEILSYSIITTEPNFIMAKIHSRMPVILAQKDEDVWLNKSEELPEILTLLGSYPAKEMVSYPVSTRVNSPINDDICLTEPLVVK